MESADSNKPPALQPRRLSSGARIIIGFGSAFVGLCVILFVGEQIVWNRHRAEKRRVQAEIKNHLAALRAAGVPLDAADLARLYPDPPPEQDAALLLKPALTAVIAPSTDAGAEPIPFVSDMVWPKGSRPLTDEAKKAGEDYLHLNEPALAAIPAAKLENAWFGRGFTNGLTNITRIPLTEFGYLSKTICLKAEWDAENGDGASAARNLLLTLALGRTLRSDILIDEGSRRGNERAAALTLERVLNLVKLSETDLVKLAAAFELADRQGTTEALRNEMSLYVTYLDDFRGIAERISGRSHLPGARLIFEYMSWKIYRDSDCLDYIVGCEQGMAAMKLPYTQRMAALVEQEKLIDAAKPRSMASLLTSPHFTNTIRTVTGISATIRGARATLAVERWRLAHGGRIPESLSELVPTYLPSVPVDPFDEKPLRYKKLSPGYLIYSVGKDLQDNGGRSTGADDDNSDPCDIVFTVRR